MVNNSTNINTSTQWTPIRARYVSLKIEIVGFYDLSSNPYPNYLIFYTMCFTSIKRAKFEFLIKSDGQQFHQY
jgi:hypothetical protein